MKSNTFTLTTRGEDGNSEVTGTSGVVDGVQGLDGEGGSNGSRGGGHGEGSEGDRSTIDLSTSVELLAVPDGVGVGSANALVL